MLRITHGDDKSFAVQFPGSPDITGCTVFFTVKPAATVNDLDPSDANAIIQVDESAHTHPAASPTTGKTVITVPAAQSGSAAAVVGGDYVYDIQLVDTGGKTHTYKKRNGDLPPCEITPEATQRNN